MSPKEFLCMYVCLTVFIKAKVGEEMTVWSFFVHSIDSVQQSVSRFHWGKCWLWVSDIVVRRPLLLLVFGYSSAFWSMHSSRWFRVSHFPLTCLDFKEHTPSGNTLISLYRGCKRMNLISGVEHTTCSFFWKLCKLKSQIAKCQRLYRAS